MKIYLEIFNNEIVGWGTSEGGVALAGMPIVDIDPNDPFFENPNNYIFENGELKEK